MGGAFKEGFKRGPFGWPGGRGGAPGGEEEGGGEKRGGAPKGGEKRGGGGLSLKGEIFGGPKRKKGGFKFLFSFLINFYNCFFVIYSGGKIQFKNFGGPFRPRKFKKNSRGP